MKIVFDEKDQQVVERYRKGDLGVSIPFIGEDTTKCSLELKINDPYKCSVFLSGLFYSLRDYTKEQCGFEVEAVSLIGVHTDLGNLRPDIRQAVDNVLHKHNII